LGKTNIIHFGEARLCRSEIRVPEGVLGGSVLVTIRRRHEVLQEGVLLRFSQRGGGERGDAAIRGRKWSYIFRQKSRLY